MARDLRDRLATMCKSHIHIYINKGQIVAITEEMQIALLCHGGVSNVHVFMWQYWKQRPK